MYSWTICQGLKITIKCVLLVGVYTCGKYHLSNIVLLTIVCTLPATIDEQQKHTVRYVLTGTFVCNSTPQ